jgi:hypothetical protein
MTGIQRYWVDSRLSRATYLKTCFCFELRSIEIVKYDKVFFIYKVQIIQCQLQ